MREHQLRYDPKIPNELDLVPQADKIGELPGPEYTGTRTGEMPKEKLPTIIDGNLVGATGFEPVTPAV